MAERRCLEEVTKRDVHGHYKDRREKSQQCPAPELLCFPRSLEEWEPVQHQYREKQADAESIWFQRRHCLPNYVLEQPRQQYRSNRVFERDVGESRCLPLFSALSLNLAAP